MKYKLSVVIPIYNGEKYIDRCMESLLSSDAENNCVEIIIINDGSNDRTQDILEKYLTIDYVNVYSKKNEGVGIARNYGIEKANGEYIWFVDVDDYIECDAIDKLLSVMDEVETDIFIFGVNKHDFQKITSIYSNLVGNYNSTEFFGFFDEYFKNNLFNPLWNKLYKREVILRDRIRFNSYISGEDQVFNFKYFSSAKKFLLMSDILYDYQVMNQGSSNYTYDVNGLENSRKRLKMLDVFLKQNGIVASSFLFENYIRSIISEYRNMVLRNYKKRFSIIDFYQRYHSNKDLRCDIKKFNYKPQDNKQKMMKMFIKVPMLMYLYLRYLYRNYE